MVSQTNNAAKTKNFVKPVLFGAATVAMMAGAALSVISVPRAPTPFMAGIDISVSAVAATTGGSKAFSIFTSGTGVSATDMAISVSTTSCNVQPTNSAPYILADWYAPFEGGEVSGAKHPYINTNVYRLNAAGRLEQLAASWTKHGWFAASSSQGAIAGANGQDACGAGSCPGGSPNDNQLGANCADTYNAGHNSDRFYIGPRSEISARGSAAAPGFALRSSFLDNVNSGGAGDTDVLATTGANNASRNYTGGGTAQGNKLATFARGDVATTALGASGRMYLESYYVVNGDVNKLNNFAFRAFSSTYSTGTPSVSQFSFAGRHTFGPVMFAWGDQQQLATPTVDGSVYVASRVVDNGNGSYRYEYNVLNVDHDGGVASISIPTGGSTLSGVSFRQPRINDPAFDTAAWTNAQPDSQSLVYAMPTAPATVNWYKPTVATKGNAIRYGNMYTFWFTSNQAPLTNGTLTMTTPTGQTLTASASIPTPVPAPVCLADLVGGDGNPPADGSVDGNDFSAFLNAFGAGDVIADIVGGDGNPPADGSVDGNDFSAFLNSFGAGC